MLRTYEKYHAYYGGEQEERERESNYTDMMGRESLRESIKHHEHFLALQLGLEPGHKVLDVGCGIGGPLREYIDSGWNNNEYQITRGKADFMKVPIPDNTYDAVYAIEATCHAPDAVGCYKEIYRVLKAGHHFAACEWCMTDAFGPNIQDHQKIKAEIELGDGLLLTRQCLDALKKAGFEVIWESDLAADSPVPWCLPLDTNHFSLSSFRLTAVGRFVTRNLERDLHSYVLLLGSKASLK